MQIKLDVAITIDNAEFDHSRRYRYLLRRGLGMGEGRITFCMLNPSTADEQVNDPTIRRCIGFGQSWGYGELLVVNLSPLRATNPRDLYAAGPEPDYVWSENLHHIRQAATASGMMVLAYGNGGKWESRGAKVVAELDRQGITPYCLGRTGEGHPRHPLYVRGDTQPEVFG